MIIDIPFLTETSRTKLEKIGKIEKIPGQHYLLDINLTNLLDKMKTSFMKKMIMTPAKPVSIQSLHKIFIDFDRSFNNAINSKLQQDILQMDGIVSVKITVNTDVIQVNFLFKKDDNPTGYMASILRALHTFCYTFPYHYDGTIINVCLDDNKRDFDFPTNNSYAEIFQYLHQTSEALNVTGVTRRFHKNITLTKKEEIIKLLFHELVHLVGLDAELTNYPYQVNWSVVDNRLHLSETYAEFIAIILNSAYLSIHLSSINGSNIYQTFQTIIQIETKYSVYLTADLLAFLGYDQYTFQNFFYGIGPKHSMPILMWEYLFLRTKMLLNLTAIAAIVQPTWQIHNQNRSHVVKFLAIDNNFINELSFAMSHFVKFDNISFTIVDINWQII